MAEQFGSNFRGNTPKESDEKLRLRIVEFATFSESFSGTFLGPGYHQNVEKGCGTPVAYRIYIYRAYPHTLV